MKILLGNARQPAILVLLLILTLGLLAVSSLACGADDPSGNDGGGQVDGEETIIDEGDLDEFPAGSPQRALLEFWREIQYKNYPSAYERLTKEFQEDYAKDIANFEKYVSADYLHWLATPDLSEEGEKSGDDKEQTMFFEYKAPDRPVERDSVTMEQEDGEWKLAYYFYLINRLRGG